MLQIRATARAVTRPAETGDLHMLSKINFKISKENKSNT